MDMRTKRAMNELKTSFFSFAYILSVLVYF